MGAKDQGADATTGRWLAIPRTLCFITHDNDVLLIKRGEHKRIYPGRYNGVGGHVERDEDVFTGALREVQEETGLEVSNLRLRGVIHVDAGESTGILVFVFSAEAAGRGFTPNSEGTLEWVPRAEVEALPLVEDLPVLLPLVLDADPNAPPFFAHTSYDAADNLIMLFANPR